MAAMRSTTWLTLQPGRVERHRIGSHPQRAVLALEVALVSLPKFVQHRRLVEAELGGTPARPLGGIGGEEDLQRRIGSDHRADVPALGHPVAAGEQLSLQRDQRLAHTRVGGNLRRLLGDLQRADLRGHIAAIQQHALAQLDTCALRQPRWLLIGRCERQERHTAVHRTAVEVGEVECVRHTTRDRGLAGSGGPVDRDHHQRASLARSSTKSG